MTTTITGYPALYLSRTLGATLNTYADPTSPAALGIDYDVAATIVRADPSLVYCHITAAQIRPRLVAFRSEAQNAGDAEGAALAEAAMNGDSGSLAEVVAMLSDAAAQIDA